MQRQAEGIISAKLSGKPFGRPGMSLPDNFNAISSEWQRIVAVDAIRKLGMKKTSFYKAVRGLG